MVFGKFFHVFSKLGTSITYLLNSIKKLQVNFKKQNYKKLLKKGLKMQSNSRNKIIQIYTNLVYNLLLEMTEEQEAFTIIVNKTQETFNQLPHEWFEDKYSLPLEISNWTLETARVTNYHLIVQLVYGFDNPRPFEAKIPLTFISSVILTSNKQLILSAPLDYQSLEPQIEEESSNLQHVVLKDTSEFEKQNAEGIKHSMSILKLCKPEQ